MKRLIFSLCLLLFLLLTACNPTLKVTSKPSITNNTSDTLVIGSLNPGMYMKTYYFNEAQVDSMCVVDKLPQNLNEWVNSSFTDYETNAIIIRYIFIKEYDNDYEMIYVITKEGEIYSIQKREAIKSEK